MSKKILVVDDDLFIREIYRDTLIGEGYEVDTASDGNEALSKLYTNRYNLILLDVIMPGTDGIGVLKKLSEDPPSNPIGPIILLSNLENDPLLKDIDKKMVTMNLVKVNMTPGQVAENIKQVLSTQTT